MIYPITFKKITLRDVNGEQNFWSSNSLPNIKGERGFKGDFLLWKSYGSHLGHMVPLDKTINFNILSRSSRFSLSWKRQTCLILKAFA